MTSRLVRFNFITEGMMMMYETSKVEIAHTKTTVKIDAASPFTKVIAATKNIEDIAPDKRFTRTGVPNLSLNSPNQPLKNEPSAAAIAPASNAACKGLHS